MDIHGIVASEHPYGRNDTSRLVVEGADISRLDGSYLYHNTKEMPMGIVTAAKRVLTLQDCASDADRGLWDLAGGKPFVRVSAKVTLHQDVWGEHLRLNPSWTTWFSMGYILERDEDVYTKTVLKDVLLGVGVYGGPYRVIPGKG